MEQDRVDRLAGSIHAHRLVLARFLTAQLIDEGEPLSLVEKLRDDFMDDLQRSITSAKAGEGSRLFARMLRVRYPS